MYSAPTDVVAATCGHIIAPIWANAYPGSFQHSLAKGHKDAIVVEKLLEGLPSSHYVKVPAYIASGLLRFVELNYGEPKVENNELIKSGASTSCLGGQDQAFHQEMLRRLALHLAAQPDSHAEACKDLEHGHADWGQDLRTNANNVNDAAVSEKLHSERSEPCKESKSKGLSDKDQEFQQEMLRKLALHLAAQDEAENNSDKKVRETEAKQIEEMEDEDVQTIVTPEVFPATPSSIGEAPCDHYYIGDDECQDDVEDTNCCWPYSSHVSVPLHIAHGLLDGFSLSQHSAGCNQYSKLKPEEQNFHNQMLQKLSLHLAAQPDSPKCTAPISAPSTKVSWADMVDDTACADIDNGSPWGFHAKSPCKADKQPGLSPAKTKNLGRPVQQEFQQDMLRKLALHLVAQPDVQAQQLEEDDASLVGQDKAKCDRFIHELGSPDATRAANTLEWVTLAARSLALTQYGSRLVQKAIDVASTEQQIYLLEMLLNGADIAELYSSPHANHVIAKLIEILPPKYISSIGEALRGKATTVARHQFGSRILERLVQFSNEDHIGFLLDELLEDFEALARHQFGNFIVARVLEHGTSARKHSCVQKLLPHVLHHATHKTACNIVQRMLENADVSSQAMIADAFLAGTGDTSLEEIATTRYGSFVIRHLVDRFHPRIDAVKKRIKGAHSQLQESGFSRRKIVDLLGEAFFRD